MRAKAAFAVAMLLAGSAGAWPKAFPDGGIAGSVGTGQSGTGVSRVTSGWGISETEPNVTVDYYWPVEEMDVDGDSPVGLIPIRGTVVVSGFQCVYDGTTLIGSDTATACLVTVTNAGASACISSVVMVNSALTADYIAPATQPSATIDASSADTSLAVKTSAITDAGPADDSTITGYCRATYFQSY